MLNCGERQGLQSFSSGITTYIILPFDTEQSEILLAPFNKGYTYKQNKNSGYVTVLYCRCRCQCSLRHRHIFSITGIAGSKYTEGTDIHLLCLVHVE
jgi:hypothetical protein